MTVASSGMTPGSTGAEGMTELELPRPQPRRIAVIGTSCSGKSTFARELSARTGIPHLELDAHFWEPGWREAAPDIFRGRVAKLLDAPEWISDGNYGKVRDLILNRVDQLIWLDYAIHVVATRALKRTLNRVFKREVLWSGNQETFQRAFLSRDSVFLWVLKTHWRRKREYLSLANERPIVRLRSPAEASAFLDAYGASDEARA